MFQIVPFWFSLLGTCRTIVSWTLPLQGRCMPSRPVYRFAHRTLCQPPRRQFDISRGASPFRQLRQLMMDLHEDTQIEPLTTSLTGTPTVKGSAAEASGKDA